MTGITKSQALDLLSQAIVTAEAPHSGKPVDAMSVHEFESRTGIVLPGSMTELLQQVNGAYVGAGGLYGLRRDRKFIDMEASLDLCPRWKTFGWLPIGSDGCGNYYVLLTKASDGRYPVGFIDMMDGPERIAYLVASDLWHFLYFYLNDELIPPDEDSRWPFDKEFVRSIDPALENCAGGPIPWDSNGESG